MSAQVDVLAVMDATILAAEADARMYKLDDAAKAVAVFKATRAAVAALIAERDALREALLKLTEAADTSDDCQYGTLATGFVRDMARAALATGESA